MLTRLTLVFSLCFASLATAGAWPREKGTLFIAAGGNFLLSDGAQLPVHYDPTVYAEYGLTGSRSAWTFIQPMQAGSEAPFYSQAFRWGTLRHATSLPQTLPTACASMHRTRPRRYCGRVCLGGADWTTAGLRPMHQRHMAQMRGPSGPKLISHGGAGGRIDGRRPCNFKPAKGLPTTITPKLRHRLFSISKTISKFIWARSMH